MIPIKFKLFGKAYELRENEFNFTESKSWQSFVSQFGYAITADTALQTATVFRCVDVIAKTMASLPCVLYKKTSNGKEKAQNHDLYEILHSMPNPETTAFDFWMMYIFNLLLTQGAYAVVIRDGFGAVSELWNVPTQNVYKCRNAESGEQYIVVKDGDKSKKYYDFMFTPNMRFNSTDPSDPISIAGHVLKLTNNLNVFASDFFANGTNLGGIVEYPGKMGAEAFERFKQSWTDSYAGVTKAHKIAFLESGVKFTPMGKNPVEAQALESRKFQIFEICRYFGVPPHKVFELDRATYNNIEQSNTEFVQESLTPMATRIEQTIFRDLLLPAERKKYYAKFSINGLLRGDVATRSAFYNTMRQIGVLNANEIRGLEDFEEISEEDGGDEYLVNGNMVSLKYASKIIPKGLAKPAETMKPEPVKPVEPEPEEEGGADDVQPGV